MCAAFRTSAGVWRTVPCTLQVSCKCARRRQCFDVSGHWDFQRAHQRGLEGRRQDREPATHKSLLQLAMQQDTAVPHVGTECQLSWQQVQSERHRVRQALDRRQQTHGHKHVVSLSQTATTCPAQFVTGVRRSGSQTPFTLGTQSHIPALMAAMVGSALALGPEWEKACLLVDSGSEHPLLISRPSQTD